MVCGTDSSVTKPSGTTAPKAAVKRSSRKAIKQNSGVKKKTAVSKPAIKSRAKEQDVIATNGMIHDRGLNRQCKLITVFCGPSRYNGECVKKYLASKTPAEKKTLMRKWFKFENVYPHNRYYPFSPIYPYWSEPYNNPNSWEIPFDLYPKPYNKPSPYYPYDRIYPNFINDPYNKSNPWQLPVVFEWRIPQNSQNRQKSPDPNPCKVLFPDWFKQDIYKDYLRFNPKLKTDSKFSKSNKPIVNIKLKIDKQMPVLPLPENSPEIILGSRNLERQ